MTEIDLTKPFILDKPVKCWVKDKKDKTWSDRWLKGRNGCGRFVTVTGINHDEIPTNELFMLLNITVWDECILTDPNAKQVRELTDKELFDAMDNGAKIMDDEGDISNYWCTAWTRDGWRICYNYTGTDADVWKPMEVEE